MSAKPVGENPPHRTEESTTGGTQEPPHFVFEMLSHGAREVLIEHNAQTYRLRATKNGKLILNK